MEGEHSLHYQSQNHASQSTKSLGIVISRLQQTRKMKWLEVFLMCLISFQIVVLVN